MYWHHWHIENKTVETGGSSKTAGRVGASNSPKDIRFHTMEQTSGGLVLRWFRARAAGKILYDCLGESFPAADVHQKLQVWIPKSVRTSNHTSGIKWHFDLRPSLSSSMILFGSLFGPGCSRDRGLGLNKFCLPVQGCGTLKTDYGRWCFFFVFGPIPRGHLRGVNLQKMTFSHKSWRFESLKPNRLNFDDGFHVFCQKGMVWC